MEGKGYYLISAEHGEGCEAPMVGRNGPVHVTDKNLQAHAHSISLASPFPP